jgi:hypothetical protein
LHDGPWVVEIPPISEKAMFMGSAIDSWEVPLCDLGPEGEDKGKGGQYLIVPPDFSGTIPNGYFVVRSPTYFVHVGLRPIARPGATLEDAVAYAKELRTWPLSAADNPPESTLIDAFPKAWNTLPAYDENFFKLLKQSLDEEYPDIKNAAMLDMLASLGIEKGKDFSPTAEEVKALRQAALNAKRYMSDYVLENATMLFWPDRQWRMNKPADNHGYSFFDGSVLDYDRRAGGFAYYATFAPRRSATQPNCPPPTISSSSTMPMAIFLRATAPIA